MHLIVFIDQNIIGIQLFCFISNKTKFNSVTTDVECHIDWLENIEISQKQNILNNLFN